MRLIAPDMLQKAPYKALLRGALLAMLGMAGATPAFAQQPLVEQPLTQQPWFIRGQAGFHSYAWHLGGQLGRASAGKAYHVYEAEFAKIKHPKEVRLQNNLYSNNRTFIFGKTNNFGTLRLGYGRRLVLGEKVGLRGVELSLAGTGGLSLGVLKPVYLDIVPPNSNRASDQPLSFNSERFDADKHLSADVIGTSDFSTGLNEIRFHPGAYVKGGVTFEFADYSEDIKGLEAGFVLDVFPSAVPILVQTRNYAIWPSFYITAFLGKRW